MILHNCLYFEVGSPAGHMPAPVTKRHVSETRKLFAQSSRFAALEIRHNQHDALASDRSQSVQTKCSLGTSLGVRSSFRSFGAVATDLRTIQFVGFRAVANSRWRSSRIPSLRRLGSSNRSSASRTRAHRASERLARKLPKLLLLLHANKASTSR